MNENENKVCPVSCKIEHHAMMFAFLANMQLNYAVKPEKTQSLPE